MDVVVRAAKLSKFLLPKQRPMDDMAAGLDRPQEDEFALVNLGLPSPYLAWAFPNHGPVDDEYLDLRTLPTAERDRWKRKWREFVHRVALANNRRIVLKSPTHTARVRTILEVFPDAKFIHIVRDPLVLFPSTVRLWKSLSEVQGFQHPRDDADWMEKPVLDNFVRMYECFEQDRELIPPGRLVDIRYEDLWPTRSARCGTSTSGSTWATSPRSSPALMRYAMKSRDYKTNKYTLPPGSGRPRPRSLGAVLPALRLQRPRSGVSPRRDRKVLRSRRPTSVLCWIRQPLSARYCLRRSRRRHELLALQLIHVRQHFGHRGVRIGRHRLVDVDLFVEQLRERLRVRRPECCSPSASRRIRWASTPAPFATTTGAAISCGSY